MEVIVTSDRKLGEISPTYPGRIQKTYLYYGVKCQSIDPSSTSATHPSREQQDNSNGPRDKDGWVYPVHVRVGP